MREVFFQPVGPIAPGSFTGLDTNDLALSVEAEIDPILTAYMATLDTC